ncbi:MAG: tail fiber protein [Pseudomonadota bacterium]
MTLTSSTAKVSYAGNGSTTVFAVTFRFLANSDVDVILRNAAGVETTWVENTQYTLEGEGEAAGGTLTVLTDPDDYTPASGETLVIRRMVPVTQETDYSENDSFPAETHEAALDKLTMLAQQLDETLARAVTVPVSDTAASIAMPIDSARAGKFLSFDGTGQPIAAAGTSADLTPVSTFMNTLLDDGDAAAARATLGALANVMTTRGDVVRAGASGVAERVALGSNGQVLSSNGTDAVWTSLLPAGSIVMYGAGGGSEPSGWLLCDGQAVSRTTYADLFAVIATTYGAGNGSTTFNVPDLRARFALGTNDAALPNGADGGLSTRNEGNEGGAENHTLSVDEMPAHTHQGFDSPGGTASGPGGAGNTVGGTSVTGSTGGGNAHNNMPPFTVVNFLIKT